MIPEGSKVTMTSGSNTYEYVAGKAQPLPFNKESRDWIHEVPLNNNSLWHGNWFDSPDVRERYGDELLEQVNQPGGTPIIPKGYATGGYVVQKPSVGRVVHYRSYGTPGGEYTPEVRAAIITAVSGDDEDIRVSLCVLNPTGMFFTEKVSYSVRTPGCWSWPPRA